MLGTTIQSGVNYGAFSKSFSYSYAANGQKASFTAPDGTTYEYAYGQNNELREVQIPDLGAITISEYAWTRPKTILYPGGSTRELGYDGLMRLKKITSTAPGGTSLLDYSYAYDSSGNIMSKTTEHGEYTYDYDSASRLTSAGHPILDDEAYAYDEVGNRTSASNANGEIAHNANNELTTYGDQEFVYDDNGNLTEVWQFGGVAKRFSYNADNRLVKAVTAHGAIRTEYYYDPFGRRLWKEVNGVKTYFFYSDEGLAAEYGPGGVELRSYGYKPDSTWTTDPLWLKTGGQYSFYQNDHLGTPQKLVAQNGMVAWSATYSAFGEAHIDTEHIRNPLRFPGQYYDAETGLHYNFQRYYDPGIGRYVTKDPIGFDGGDYNLYGYVRNNPVDRADKYGLLNLNLCKDLYAAYEMTPCCPSEQDIQTIYEVYRQKLQELDSHLERISYSWWNGIQGTVYELGERVGTDESIGWDYLSCASQEKRVKDALEEAQKQGSIGDCWTFESETDHSLQDLPFSEEIQNYFGLYDEEMETVALHTYLKAYGVNRELACWHTIIIDPWKSKFIVDGESYGPQGPNPEDWPQVKDEAKRLFLELLYVVLTEGNIFHAEPAY